jgi:uncharacterized protein (DUF433 family)
MRRQLIPWHHGLPVPAYWRNSFSTPILAKRQVMTFENIHAKQQGYPLRTMFSGGLAMFDPGQWIVRNPSLCNGQPTLRGTRVLLRVVLGYLAQGESIATILEEFPSLTEDHLRACIAFAAASAAEDLPAPPPGPRAGNAA